MLLKRFSLALFLALAFCALPTVAHAQVDTTGDTCSNQDTSAAETTVSCLNMNVTSQTNSYLQCGYITNNNSDLNPTLTWTGGSQNIPAVSGSEAIPGTGRYLQLFGLVNPTAANSTVDSTGGDGSGRDYIFCKHYWNVDQSTPTNCSGCTSSTADVVQGTINSTQSSVAIPSAAGDVVFACFGKANSSDTVWTATTATTDELSDLTLGAGGKGSCADDDAGDGGTIRMAPSWTTNSSNSLVSTNIVAASAGATPGCKNGLFLLGAGC